MADEAFSQHEERGYNGAFRVVPQLLAQGGEGDGAGQDRAVPDEVPAKCRGQGKGLPHHKRHVPAEGIHNPRIRGEPLQGGRHQRAEAGREEEQKAHREVRREQEADLEGGACQKALRTSSADQASCPQLWQKDARSGILFAEAWLHCGLPVFHRLV